MGRDAGFEAEVRQAAEYVKDHAGCIQAEVISALTSAHSGRSFGWAHARVKAAVASGQVIERKAGNRIHLYPAGHKPTARRR